MSQLFPPFSSSSSCKDLSSVIHGLTEEHLVSFPGAPNVKLTPGAAAAFGDMRREALKDGINLRAASAFRSFERQKLIFSEKMTGKRPVLDRNENPLDIRTLSPRDLVRAILVFSAIPGLSRHHYGTDIDVYDPDLIPEGGTLELTNREYRSGPEAPVTRWLDSRMGEFGFFRPYTDDTANASGELWHISYAPDADVITMGVSEEESRSFILNSDLPGKEILAENIGNEFTRRFRIFSPGTSRLF